MAVAPFAATSMWPASPRRPSSSMAVMVTLAASALSLLMRRKPSAAALSIGRQGGDESEATFGGLPAAMRASLRALDRSSE